MRKEFGVETPVIPVGVDTELFTPSSKKLDYGKIKVLYVGTFQERKRPYLVLEAAKHFPDVEFHLVGDGELKQPLLEKQKREKIQNVYIHKSVPQKQLISYMHKADIFLFPSIFEGCGKVTLEASATGLPCIVFDDYKPETVVDGETGYIVKSVDEMFERLEKLISNEKLRRVMGKNARNYVCRKFDWAVVVKQWERVLINLKGTYM